MTNEERWEYIRKCLNEPDGAPDYYPVSIYSLQPGDTAWLAKRMLARDDVLWMLARHDVDIARVKELEAQAALDATVVEAIGPYREADSAVTRAYNRYVASKGTSEEAVAEFDLNWTRGVFVGYERVLDDALDAALAARKGMT